MEPFMHDLVGKVRIEGTTGLVIWSEDMTTMICIDMLPEAYEGPTEAPEGMAWHPILEKFVPEELLEATIEIYAEHVPMLRDDYEEEEEEDEEVDDIDQPCNIERSEQ